MKRIGGAWVVLAALSGCVSVECGNEAPGGGCGCGTPPAVPGVQGPWGQPVPMAAPYSAAPPSDAAALAMMSQSMPLELVQPQTGVVRTAGTCPPGGCPPNVQMPAGAITPPGVPYGPGLPAGGGNQIAVPFAPGSIRAGPPGAVAAVGALTGHAGQPFPTQRTSVRFAAPVGMKVSWYAPGPDGKPTFSATPLEVPGRYNFAQAAIYRLKLTSIPKHPELELYPTLEVVPANSRTSTFLAHTSVPLSFTEEDFEQVAAGNYVVKVIYLPDPNYQDLAAAGPDEVVSTRLAPGANPIDEALQRGSILLVVRMGNIDLELSNSPAMDAPSPYMQHAPVHGSLPPAGMGPGGPRPGPMVPYGFAGQGGPTAGSNGSIMLNPNGTGPGAARGPNIGSPAQPSRTLPPQGGTILVPATPGIGPRVIPGGPIGQLPQSSGIQPASSKTSAAPTAAQLAAQDRGVVPATEKKSGSRWRWPWSKSDDSSTDSK